MSTKIRPYFTDDIFIGIFYFFPEGTRQFRHDFGKINEFFYERQKRLLLKDL
ncbi:MAG: hypothetical protein KAT43_03205 [Nanoarchaeota archaeon]|nr:hypothetical protein [Nanoarchaeota archaeon]